MRFVRTAARSSGSRAPIWRPPAWSACSSERSASRTGSRCWPTDGCRGRERHLVHRVPQRLQLDPVPGAARGRRVPRTAARRSSFAPGPVLRGFAVPALVRSMLILGAGRDGAAWRSASLASCVRRGASTSLDGARPRDRPVFADPGARSGRRRSRLQRTASSCERHGLEHHRVPLPDAPATGSGRAAEAAEPL